MYMIRLIEKSKRLILGVLALLSICSISASDIQKQSATIEIPINEVRKLLKETQKSGFVGSLDWSKYGDVIVGILTIENDPTFVEALFDWLVKGIPDSNWKEPADRFHTFLKDTQFDSERCSIRLKVLDLLLYKTRVENYSKPEFTVYLFDSMKALRYRLTDVLSEDGNAESIYEVNRAIESLNSKSNLDGSEPEEIRRMQKAVKAIEDRARCDIDNPIPNQSEIRRQYQRIIELLPKGVPDDTSPLGVYDGCKYVIDRWSRFKWGAKQFLESSEESEKAKCLFVTMVLSRVYAEDWNDAFPLIIGFYDSVTGVDKDDCCPESLKEIVKESVVRSVIDRNNLGDLDKFSKILCSEDPSDNRSRGHLIRKYQEIGTKDSIPELKKAAAYWSEKGQIGWVATIEKAILAIEQRTTQTPQPVATCEPHAGLLIIE